MKKPLKKWISVESAEAKRKSISWSSQNPLSKSKEELFDNQWWRLSIIDLIDKLKPNSISGKVMDVGAGLGRASAYLTSFSSVKTVYSIDYSKEACNKIIETTANFSKAVPRKLIAVHGSFDDIKENNFDLIVAFGALHNSPDLSLTFKSLFNKLSPKGLLVVSDMCLSFEATKKDEEWATNRFIPNSKTRYGKKLRFRDTNDYFRSIYDYFFFSKQAGFRVYPIVWDLKSKNKLTNLKKDLNGSFPEKFFPSFSRGHFDPLLLICEKSKEINHSTLPDASIYSNTFNKLVKINYLIRIYLNKIIQIFNIYGFKKGFKLIISKIKNIMKKND